MVSIYTRRGDKGKTSLCEKRLRKSHPCIHFLGSLDEAMAFVGLAIENIDNEKIVEELKFVYELLSKIAGAIATEWCPDESIIREIEKKIDQAPKPSGFIPNYSLKHPGVALLALVRTTIRRAERWFWECENEELLYCENIGKLLNRLSDLVFILQYLQYKD